MKRDTPKEAPKAAEVLTLQSLSGKLSIPFQASFAVSQMNAHVHSQT